MSTTGQLNTVTAPDTTLQFTYDGILTRSTAWSGAVAGRLDWTWDNNFRMSGESVNGSSSIAFGYDADNLMTSAGALTITRDPQTGIATQATLGNTVETITPDGYGDEQSRSFQSGGSTVASFGYVRDDFGRITQKTESIAGVSHVETYTYDDAGRLFEVHRDGALIATYTYDGNGNRLSAATPGGTTSGSYDGQDRLTTWGGTAYTYTPVGDLQTKTDTSGTTAYAYDAFGNLRQVELPSGTTVSYLADGLHRRIGRLVNGVRTQAWLYSTQLHLVAELDGSNNLISRFVYGTHLNVPDYMIRGGVTYRFISDHLGSVRLVVDAASGTVAQQIDYDAWGNVVADSNPGFQPFGFAGGLYDPLTGLVRFGDRDYDAAIGRWTTQDPGGFTGGGNLYAYAFGDPVNMADADGHFAQVVAAIIGGVVGAGTSLGWQMVANWRAGRPFSCIDWKDVIVSGAGGAVAGALMPFTLANAALVGAGVNTGQYAASTFWHGGTPTFPGAFQAAAKGAIGGVIAGAFGRGMMNAESPRTLLDSGLRREMQIMNDRLERDIMTQQRSLVRSTLGSTASNSPELPLPPVNTTKCGCDR